MFRQIKSYPLPGKEDPVFFAHVDFTDKSALKVLKQHLGPEAAELSQKPLGNYSGMCCHTCVQLPTAVVTLGGFCYNCQRSSNYISRSMSQLLPACLQTAWTIVYQAFCQQHNLQSDIQGECTTKQANVLIRTNPALTHRFGVH